MKLTAGMVRSSEKKPKETCLPKDLQPLNMTQHSKPADATPLVKSISYFIFNHLKAAEISFTIGKTK